jgi:hypothetical protein|tara:strand:+ start:218 stop:478 length:261 start_codon:yes stop_codon:yes gene_type:complete
MGRRLKEMQSAWDKFNIPPASSTAVDNEVHIPDSNLGLNSKKSSKIKEVIANNKDIKTTKAHLIKSGNYNSNIPDSELVAWSLSNK